MQLAKLNDEIADQAVDMQTQNFQAYFAPSAGIQLISNAIDSQRMGNAQHRHGQTILNDEKARAIFKCKQSPHCKERCKAADIGKHYGVSAKTVRDIWVGRTWYRATYYLDPTKPISTERLQKRPGRPKGAKDSKQRTRKWQKRELMANEAQFSNFQQLQTSGQGTIIISATYEGGSSSCEQTIFQDASIENSASATGGQVEQADPVVMAPDQNCNATDQNCNAAESVTEYRQNWDSIAFASALPEFEDPFHDDWVFWQHHDPSRAAMFVGCNGPRLLDAARTVEESP